MIYVLYFPDDSVRSFMEDLLYLLLAFPIMLLYHGNELFKWWRGETFNRAIVKALKAMEVERANTPAGEINPIFCKNWDQKQGHLYDKLGLPYGNQTPKILGSREGRFNQKQVHAIKKTFSGFRTDFFMFVLYEEGWWEYLPSTEKKIRDIRRRFQRIRARDDEHRYVKD